MREDLGQLLDHVPELVKAYGKWPSFAYLCFATAGSSVVVAVALYHLLR
jgi:hypothetical protein